MPYLRKKGQAHTASEVTLCDAQKLMEKHGDRFDDHFEIVDAPDAIPKEQIDQLLAYIEKTTNQGRLVKLAGHKVKVVSSSASSRLNTLNE